MIVFSHISPYFSVYGRWRPCMFDLMMFLFAFLLWFNKKENDLFIRSASWISPPHIANKHFVAPGFLGGRFSINDGTIKKFLFLQINIEREITHVIKIAVKPTIISRFRGRLITQTEAICKTWEQTWTERICCYCISTHICFTLWNIYIFINSFFLSNWTWL